MMTDFRLIQREAAGVWEHQEPRGDHASGPPRPPTALRHRAFAEAVVSSLQLSGEGFVSTVAFTCPWDVPDKGGHPCPQISVRAERPPSQSLTFLLLLLFSLCAPSKSLCPKDVQGGRQGHWSENMNRIWKERRSDG